MRLIVTDSYIRMLAAFTICYMSHLLVLHEIYSFHSALTNPVVFKYSVTTFLPVLKARYNSDRHTLGLFDKRTILVANWHYVEDTERSLMNGGDDRTRSFPFSVYHYIPLQPSLCPTPNSSRRMLLVKALKWQLSRIFVSTHGQTSGEGHKEVRCGEKKNRGRRLWRKSIYTTVFLGVSIASFIWLWAQLLVYSKYSFFVPALSRYQVLGPQPGLPFWPDTWENSGYDVSSCRL
jgi:hypothetical protein